MKKKTLSKILSLALVVIMSISLFTGCAKSLPTDAPKPSEKKLSENEPGWTLDTSPITYDWYVNFSWFTRKWGEDKTSQYITNKTGVSINYLVPAGNEAEKLNTMLVSGKLPDFITLGWWEDAVKKMIEGDLVLPLDELAKQYDPYFIKVADPQKTAWYTQENGHFYGYPNASSSPRDFENYKEFKPSNQTFVVRKDMYEALGKPDMRTPEGFLNALKAAKEKFGTVNGQPLIPLGMNEFTDVGNTSLEDYLQNFLAIPMEKDGKLNDRRNDPEYIAWLKTFRKANEMGLLSKDIFVDKRSQMEEKIAQGRYFAMIFQRSDFASQQQALFQNDPNSIYIAVDGPANSKLDAPKLAGDGLAGWTITLISKDVKDKERAIRFLSYLISEEGQKDLFLGEKGVTWDNIDGKDQFKPEVLAVKQSDNEKFEKEFGAHFTHWMLMDTTMMLKWAPQIEGPGKQLEDWTKGKTYSYALYDNINPTGDSTEGVANSSIAQLWGKTLPTLLMAKTEKEFDDKWNEFLEKRKSLGQDKVDEYRQTHFLNNKSKLGM